MFIQVLSIVVIFPSHIFCSFDKILVQESSQAVAVKYRNIPGDFKLKLGKEYFLGVNQFL